MNNRVVITGIGIISPAGTYPGNYWSELIKGTSGISELKLKGFEKCYSKKYGLIDKSVIAQLENEHLSEAEKQLPIYDKYAITAASMAAENADISFDTFEDKIRTGVFLGTAYADMFSYYEDDHKCKNRFTAPTDIATHFDIHGGTYLNANACAAGNQAISHAAEQIRSGTLDIALAGGSDSYSLINYVMFTRLKVLSEDTIKPFDVNRDGIILSEGSAFLVLESLEHAQKRGCKILGELLGSGITNDAYNIVAPDPSANGVILAMKRAIENSGISPEDIDYISVHGTGTPANDLAEAHAIEKVFGKHANDIWASSIKSCLGHQLGAASALAMATNMLIFEHNMLPPTINTAKLMDIPFKLVTDTHFSQKVDMIMNNAYAFGGGNCCVIVKRWCET